MTDKHFAELKADLLKTYADDLCEESVVDIKNAHSLPEFIGVLNKYTAFLKYKNIPKIDWVRKWFSEYRADAESCGCYIDGTRLAINPTMPITLYGKAKVTLVVNEARIYQVTLQDESQLTVSAYGVSAVNIRQKDNSEVSVAFQSDLSKIKIRKV